MVAILASALLRCLLAAVALALAPPATLAQDHGAAQPIKVVVPVPPGAAVDVLPRVIGDRLSARLGRPIIFENVPGANSNLGARIVARAEPDGRTLLVTPPGPLVINQSLYADVGFDPRGFVPVTVLMALTNVLVTNPNAPFSSLPQMLAYARANPGKLSYASAGLGSGPHLAMEWLAQRAGVRLTHVPYNGLTRALSDVLAGHVDMMFNSTANVLPLVREGKLRPIGVDSEARVPELADVPAIAEQFPGYVVTTWFAIVAPPKTPPAVASTLSSTIAEVLKEPAIANRLRELSATSIGSSPADAAEFIDRERARWHEIVTAAGIRMH